MHIIYRNILAYLLSFSNKGKRFQIGFSLVLLIFLSQSTLQAQSISEVWGSVFFNQFPIKGFNCGFSNVIEIRKINKNQKTTVICSLNSNELRSLVIVNNLIINIKTLQS